MLHLRRVPGRPLAAHVAEMLYFADAPPQGSARYLPAGMLQLAFNLDDEQVAIRRASGVHHGRSGAVVSGAHRSYFALDGRKRTAIIAVHFRPGGAWPFLGVPPGELADLHVDLTALWGARAVELRERLWAATTPDLRFDILERALLDRFVRARAGHPAVPHAVAALEAGAARIADVADDLGLSHRRLVDVFTAEVGLGPKTFARIVRFQRTLLRARRDPQPDWAQLAHAFGYCDQSHLVREFVAIAGDSPTALLARAAARTTPPCHERCRLA